MGIVCCSKQKDISKGLPVELKNRESCLHEDDNLYNSCEHCKILM